MSIENEILHQLPSPFSIFSTGSIMFMFLKWIMSRATKRIDESASKDELVKLETRVHESILDIKSDIKHVDAKIDSLVLKFIETK